MRVLGIDPGTRLTGWGVVEARGPKLHACAAGVIRAGERCPLPERLARIEAGLVELIEAHAPAVVAVEEIFFAKHANAALKLGHARGVVLLVAEKAALPIHEYAPTLVKRTVAGRGGASKDQVAQLVGALLGLSALPSVDATDALAIAITHCQAARARGAVLASKRRA
ncbi:MAG: crossover junction endodeoxyribonuclease RuvC [Myxococcota bacterium]